MTFREFAAHIAKLDEGVPDTAIVRIGGKTVEHLGLSTQIPLKKIIPPSGLIRREHDDMRPWVIDILVDGEEALPLDEIIIREPIDPVYLG